MQTELGRENLQALEGVRQHRARIDSLLGLVINKDISSESYHYSVQQTKLT
jgi:hypothetical protein